MPIGTYTPPPLANHYTKKNFILFFFHFRCILLQISHKKCFLISISILGRSGVNDINMFVLAFTADSSFNMTTLENYVSHIDEQISNVFI